MTLSTWVTVGIADTVMARTPGGPNGRNAAAHRTRSPVTPYTVHPSPAGMSHLSLAGRGPAHFAIAVLHWDTKQDALAALASPPGEAAIADFANFAGAGVDIELGEVQS